MTLLWAGLSMSIKKNVQFYIYIAYFFTGLMLLFAIAMGTVQFTRMSKIILAQADSSYTLIGNEVASNVKDIYEPVKSQTEILAQAHPISGKNLNERLSHVNYLAKAIISVKSATSAYVGFADGEFFLLRQYAKSNGNKDVFKAPARTEWIVQSTSLEAGKLIEHVVYLDDRLNEISRQQIPLRNYDPRLRGWYENAMKNPSQANVSEPYYFFTTGQIGVTYAQKIVDVDAVVGIDIELPTIHETIKNSSVTPSTSIALIDRKGQLLAWKNGRQAAYKPQIVTKLDGTQSMPTLAEQDAPVLNKVRELASAAGNTSQALDVAGQTWASYQANIQIPGGQDLHILIASPHDELLADIIKMRQQTIMLFLVMLAIGIGVTIYFSRLASKPLKQLNDEASKIARFDFKSPINIQSRIKEIADLTHSMRGMKATIRSFLDIASSLASETNYDKLLARVLKEMSEITDAKSGILYLYQPQDQSMQVVQVYVDHQVLESDAQHIAMTDGEHPVIQACKSRSSSICQLQATDLPRFFSALPTTNHVTTLIAIPLKDRNNILVGAIALVIDDADIDPGRQAMAEAVSGAAAVAIENQRLIQEQKALLEAFIQLIASAIDAKSPYTGGHCQRVPVLTKLLAQAACKETEGPFAGFQLSDTEWEELHIAAWLHDCGKVTTPEYIVDKATKLETLYDRIHEIRMRFEVLKRDAQIDYWQAVANDSAGNDATELKKKLDDTIAQLDSDFAFLAECNEGGEFMAPDKIARIQDIAGRHWLRTLSDRIGISHDEKERKNRTTEPALPVQEQLLSDKTEHIFTRSPRDTIAPDNPWGFKVKVPEHLYNRGEVYNLTVARGTLSEEERYKINEHMIQTIMMLEKLPFPRHLAKVPEIAGGHHEKMDGTGYPKRLSATDMSIPARMMAIADIFEALTAADRPYKKGKTLSEAIKIMSFMKKDQHIDAELFGLFLKSGAYLEYGKQFMNAEQIDEFDIHAYL
ncbi:GAF domain-containing protein [Undibacterium sp. CY18W]|uniref:GAF domain-containing protein n=1 Tax=Undibacterium hunanense TaxID=2762292 RepID=A0ABR6ZSF3_9BURK|nr:HD domain-containing phosphohydrolase [Undibacterium hunanense]MBC3918787.1 GAF domain-containing protein [Undibacterium hunanense]